jgi:hypothetical protein
MEDYTVEAREWLRWTSRSTRWVQETTNVNELTRFRTDDMPPKQRDKQRLSDQYRELQVTFSTHLSLIVSAAYIRRYEQPSR